MCITCGCSDNVAAVVTALDHSGPIPSAHVLAHGHAGHDHEHSAHEHEHGHEAAHEHGYRGWHQHVHESAHDHKHEGAHDHKHLHPDNRRSTHRHSHVFDPDRAHSHPHVHDGGIAQAQEPGKTVSLEAALLAKNDRIAERNRGWFAGRDIVALNLVSSPGSGKTTLLERTIRDLGAALPIAVVEGDQETTNDARRIAATGCKVVQINTGTGCHLDADMVARGLRELDPPARSVVMIENVGNLVCPALFDLGERAKVAILSVTEGEDKPLKYPHMFRAAQLMILNKIDLLPYVDFDVQRCIDYAHRVNPGLRVLQVSAIHGQGLGEWYDWLWAEFARGESITAFEQV